MTKSTYCYTIENDGGQVFTLGIMSFEMRVKLAVNFGVYRVSPGTGYENNEFVSRVRKGYRFRCIPNHYRTPRALHTCRNQLVQPCIQRYEAILSEAACTFADIVRCSAKR